MNKVYISIISTLVLAGCAVGPDYVKPKIDTPDSFRHDIEENKTDSNNRNSKWWTQLKDERLASYVNQVLESNFDAKIADMQVGVLLAQFDEAKSYLYPQLSANPSLIRQNPSLTTNIPMPPGPIDSYTANLSIASYELDLWGKVRRLNEAARAKLLSSEEARRGVKISLTTNATLVYYKLLAIAEQTKISKEFAECASKRLEFSKLMHEQGTISDSDLNDAILNDENAKNQYLSYQKKLVDIQNEYNLLLGKMPTNMSNIDTEKIYSANITVPVGLPSTILENRPDILSAEQELIAANAQIGVAKAAYFPTISLTGEFGFQSADFNKLFKGDSRMWQFGPSVNIPIFTAGRIGAGVASAEYLQKEALLNYQKTIVAAFSETDSALFGYKNAKEQEKSAKNSEHVMAENLRMAELRYKYGTISMPVLLSTKQTYLSTRLALLDAKIVSLGSSLSLIKSLGGGF